MKTVYGQAEIEYIVEKSRFIGYASPAVSVEEAESYIADVRKKHWDATHNVPAFVIGERQESQKCSDDGEPSGTAGAPSMQMMAKEGITDTVVVVTRYFGGIKLGTGGLVRAYTVAAKMALEAAGICEIMEMAVMEIKLDYTFFNKLKNVSEEGDFMIEDAEFSEVVTAKLLMEKEKVEGIKTMLSELTGGSFDLVSLTFRLDKKLEKAGN